MSFPLAYLNGRFLPFPEAALPLHDAGFVSGATIVDNARTFHHKLFRWADHLARFRRDCEACFVPLEAPDEQLTATAEELVAHNAKLLPPGGELQLITFATPGPLGFYLGESVNGPPTLGMATYPLPFARYRSFFIEGVALAVVNGPANGAGSVLPPTIKHRSRLFWHIADRKARIETGEATSLALATDEHGTLAETSVASFLIVKDGSVVAPPREKILDGMSLRVTRELCDRLGIPFVHAPIAEMDLDVLEALLTGTAFGIAGVRRIQVSNKPERRFDWHGPVCRKLQAAWSDLVGVDIAKQFTEAK